VILKRIAGKNNGKLKKHNRPVPTCNHVISASSLYVSLFEQVDQVFKIIEVLGMPPDHIINKASRAEKFFERTSMGTWVPRRPRDGRKVN